MLSTSEIQRLKEIWSVCFLDSSEYISLFFSTLYKDGYVTIHTEKQEIVAAHYLLPYEITIDGKPVKASYFCAAATMPAYRSLGIMSNMIKEALQKLKSQGYKICFLIPANEGLYDYYARFGFQSVYYAKDTIVKALADSRITITPLNDANIVYQHYNELIVPKNLSVVLTKEHFDFLIKETALELGETFEIKKEGRSIGYFFYKQGIVREIVSTEDFNEISPAICAALGKTQCKFSVPLFYNAKGHEKKMGMAIALDDHISINNEFGYIGLMLN